MPGARGSQCQGKVTFWILFILTLYENPPRDVWIYIIACHSTALWSHCSQPGYAPYAQRSHLPARPITVASTECNSQKHRRMSNPKMSNRVLFQPLNVHFCRSLFSPDELQYLTEVWVCLPSKSFSSNCAILQDGCSFWGHVAEWFHVLGLNCPFIHVSLSNISLVQP